MHQILVINPGSTSTKMALYHDEREQCTHSIAHLPQELASFKTIADQFPFRTKLVLQWMTHSGIATTELSAIVGRGGLIKPIEGGCYRVNDIMIQDLTKGIQGQHASNLGGLIAKEIAKQAGVEAYIVDPVVVDELQPVARYAGHPAFSRISIFHALNQKAVAMEAALQIGKPYSQCHLIVVHLGGGISIGAHLNGKVVDVNNALNGEGPFSPERSGTLPSGQLVDYCFQRQKSKDEIDRMIVGKGGLVAYLGTNDSLAVRQRIDRGDQTAADVFAAMGYQIAKYIGSMSVVLKGKVDAIVFTGGMARDSELIRDIESQVSWIARTIVIPGERELLALALGALRVLRGEENAKEYH